MIDEGLRYVLHSKEWIKTFDLNKDNLIGSLLPFSGIHIADQSLKVYRDVLRGAYHTDKGRDMFMTPQKKRIHIHWMTWKKKDQPGGLILIANLNAFP